MYPRLLLLLIFLLLPFRLIAQTPGGVAGVDGWYKADLGTTGNTDGALITTWADQSGNGHDATESSPRSPIFNDDALNVNFNPYIRFDGGNDHLDIADNADMNQTSTYEKSMSMVFRTSNDITSRMVLFEIGGNTRGINFYIYNSSLYCGAWNTPNDGGDAPWGFFSDSSPIAVNTTYIVTMVLDGTAATNGTLSCYVNSLQFANVAGVGQLYSDSRDIAIASKQDRSYFETGSSNGNGQYFDGDIMELLYYNNKAFSAAERNQIESYLAIKYGLTLDQSVPIDYVEAVGANIYNSSTTHSSFANDVAGIGIDNVSPLNQPQSLSENTDAIVTMSNASALVDGEFLIWGNDNDDNGTIEEQASELPVTYATRLDREWRVDQTGDVGTVDISIDLNGITVTGTTAAHFALLVDTSDSNFSDATPIAADAYAGGIVTFNGVDFTGDDYFTLATSLPAGPPTVELTTNNASIAENGGVAIITASLSGTYTSDVTVTLTFSGVAVHPTDYTRTGTTIVVSAGDLNNSINVTGVDDAFSEGSESIIIDIDTVTNGTEDGVQQVTVNVSDDDPTNNACDGTEGIYTTELASGQVNEYDLTGTYQATSTSMGTGNYEMVIDPDNLHRYTASYDDFELNRADIDGANEIQLVDTNTEGPNAPARPFQIALNLDTGKMYWTEWTATASIMCSNLDGSGVTEIASNLYFPSGLEIDKNTERMYVNFGFETPIRMEVAQADGCNPITLTRFICETNDATCTADGAVEVNNYDLGYNLTIDPPGNRLFFVDFNANNIVEVSDITTATPVVDLDMYPAHTPPDQMRDIVYNKNTDELFWVHTNGTIQKADATAGSAVTTLTTGIDPAAENRSIDLCVDDAPPRLVSFRSTGPDGLYCPGEGPITIIATYDEALKAGSTLTVLLDTGDSVVLNNISGNEISGSYTIGAVNTGSDSSDLLVASITTESVSDNNDNVRINSTVPADNIDDTSAIVVDKLGPVITEVTAITTPTLDRTPTYVFTSNEDATVASYAGGCTSSFSDIVVAPTNNNMTFNSLSDGTYMCTFRAEDDNCNNHTIHPVNTFQVAADTPTVNLAIDDVDIAEDGTVATVTVSLSNQYAATVTVNLGFSGTATGSGTDYTASGSSVSFVALDTSETITITSATDMLDEDDETVITSISSIPTSNANVGTTPVTTTILDDDPLPTVTLTVSPGSITEAGGTATVRVDLNTVSGRDVTVNLDTTNGVADLTDDFTLAGSITIDEGDTFATATLTAVDDTDLEPDEDAVIDIDTITNGTEGTPNQGTTTIIEDILCNQNPHAAPDGYTTYMTFNLDNTFASGIPYSLPDGDDFDDLLSRTPAQKAAQRTAAENFFNTEYGIDFMGGNTAQGGAIMLRHISYDANFNAKIRMASGYEVDSSGGDLYAGVYQMIVVAGSAVFTGNWGGAGIVVPLGTVVEYGEYYLDIMYPCSDGVDENVVSSSSFLIGFESQRPSLADIDFFNLTHWLDIPQIFEYDVTSGAFGVGTISGRTEIRQDNATGDVTVISSAVFEN